MSLILSFMRLKKPPSGTVSLAYNGMVMTSLPASINFMWPVSISTLTGAMILSGNSNFFSSLSN